MGVHFYRSAIAEIAQNPAGAPALVYCTATLKPEEDNPHDASAVAVSILGRKVGHLSRDYAPTFREQLASHGLELRETTCDAVITNGLAERGRTYDYAIELDFLGDEPPIPSDPRHPTPSRMDAMPRFTPLTEGGCLVDVRLNADAYAFVAANDRQFLSWTTPHWDTVNYYVQNERRIGLGEKLFGVNKDFHESLFLDKTADLALVSLDGRNATFRLKP